MRRKPKNALSNLVTSSSPNNLSWENAKNSYLDRKNLTQAPFPAEVMYDVQIWPKDELASKRRTIQTPNPQSAEATTSTSKQPQTPVVKNRRAIAIIKDKINIGYKRVRQTVHKNMKKRTNPTIGKENHTYCNKVESSKNF